MSHILLSSVGCLFACVFLGGHYAWGVQVPVCNKKHDVMIALDASNSMTPAQYKLAKQFVADLFDLFPKSRASFRTFAKKDVSIFRLDNRMSRADIRKKVLCTQQQGGAIVETDQALGWDTREFLHHGNENEKKFLFVTHKPATDDKFLKEDAQRAEGSSIDVYSLGIGPVNDKLHRELFVLTVGKPQRVFITENHAELKEFLKDVRDAICDL